MVVATQIIWGLVGVVLRIPDPEFVFVWLTGRGAR